MLDDITLEELFEKQIWKRFQFFALVKPEDDVFPVRKVYNGRTQNIGSNRLASEPLWFAGPDVIASRLLSDKAPQVLRAIRIVPHGKQKGLKKTNLAGLVPIDPRVDDFFRHVIEQKEFHKPTDKALAAFLKVLGSSGSYGLFVQVDEEQLGKTEQVKVYSGNKVLEQGYRAIEKAGPWYFPPLASLITAGGRLLLAMLERSVEERGGTYLFCDTDSLCIVSSEAGGFVPCDGGPYRMADGSEVIKALRWGEVRDIVEYFNQLNPYRNNLVPDLLKIEDVNFVDGKRNHHQRELFGYAVSAKRYALYCREGDEIRDQRQSL